VIYFCCDERRRAQVRDHGVVFGVDYNGIDFLEVVDTEAQTDDERQRKLFVHFLKPLAAPVPTEKNIVISGGERIRGINVLSAKIEAGSPPNVLTVMVDKRGDYSTYTLRLVKDILQAGDETSPPPDAFDVPLSSIEFSFKVECPSDFDCRTDRVCAPDSTQEADIDYLAKDYNSFRQAMLDRMSVLVPQWQERNAADVGVALVELLAYVGDHLSYQQDVIATEAYLDTARRRMSVRRHALLVDYAMHDGCNARTWVQVRPKVDGTIVERGTRLITRVPGLPDVFDPATTLNAVQRIADAGAQTFETAHDITLHETLNEIAFYTWDDERCCLPAGATSATLLGDFEKQLHEGDVLILEEKAGPITGEEGDADPAHRHAVRLTSVKSSHDSLFPDPDDPTIPLRITEITWHGEDALPFALCVSAETEKGTNAKVSVALGNIVLADHGLTIKSEHLGNVPDAVAALATVASSGGDRCADHTPEPVRPRFSPQLKEAPLTQAAPKPAAPDAAISATSVFEWELRDVLPDMSLKDGNGGGWSPQHDLLSSDAFASEFVAEVDDAGRATLRFGDDEYGLRPTPGISVDATYRFGNGTRGNIGADSIAHVLTTTAGILSVRNPLPARGGVDPETIEHVRRSAPSAFRIQERAVTADDYASVAERHREVQRAAATIRWTGSWRTVFLTVDRLGGRNVDDAFERDLRTHLERYRMAGHDVEIDGPRFVPLELEMEVCVKPEYARGDVRAALLRVFGRSTNPDGQRGFFHPDNFSFGQPVYLSALYAAAQKLDGVRFVTIGKFQRLGINSTKALDEGVLAIGRLEIARLDNDPNFAERGVMRLTLDGGR
jgi:hypothetical protein